jgi:hypothetical protein
LHFVLQKTQPVGQKKKHNPKHQPQLDFELEKSAHESTSLPTQGGLGITHTSTTMSLVVPRLEMNLMLQKTARSDRQNWAALHKGFYGHRSIASTAKVPPLGKVSRCIATCRRDASQRVGMRRDVTCCLWSGKGQKSIGKVKKSAGYVLTRNWRTWTVVCGYSCQTGRRQRPIETHGCGFLKTRKCYSIRG